MDKDDDIPLTNLIRELQENVALAQLSVAVRRCVSLKDVIDADQTIHATGKQKDDNNIDSLTDSISSVNVNRADGCG